MSTLKRAYKSYHIYYTLYRLEIKSFAINELRVIVGMFYTKPMLSVVLVVVVKLCQMRPTLFHFLQHSTLI